MEQFDLQASTWELYLLLHHCCRSAVLRRICVHCVNQPEEEESEDVDEYCIPEKDDKLEIHLISLTTLYYICFAILSVLGTIYGYTQLWGYYLFAYHFLNIISGNQLLQRVIRAISGTRKLQCRTRRADRFPTKLTAWEKLHFTQ